MEIHLWILRAKTFIFLLLKDYVYFTDKNGPNLTKIYYV